MANRLTGTSGGVTLSYDPLDRLWQTAGSSTTRFAYSGASLIAEYDQNNVLLRRYVPGPGIDEPIVWYEGAGTADRRWLHADQQGSVIAVSNAAGQATATNTYDEYGIPGSANQGRFQYTGQTWLPEAGLYYYKARVYSPTLGRFLQTDPIGYADGLNWYAYTHGDPVNGTDPMGLDTIEELVVAAKKNGCPAKATCVTLDGVRMTQEYAQRIQAMPINLGEVVVTARKNKSIFRRIRNIFSPQTTQQACSTGSTRQYGLSYSLNGFLAVVGVTGSVTAGVSVPDHGAGWQSFIAFEGDPMLGTGVSLGTAAGPTWGHSPTPMSSGPNPVGGHLEGGANLAYGGSIGQTRLPDGSVSTSVGIAAPPVSAKAGVYFGLGPAYSAQLATSQFGCKVAAR